MLNGPELWNDLAPGRSDQLSLSRPILMCNVDRMGQPGHFWPYGVGRKFGK